MSIKCPPVAFISIGLCHLGGGCHIEDTSATLRRVERKDTDREKRRRESDERYAAKETEVKKSENMTFT